MSSTKTTTGANPMRDYLIQVDVLEAVQDFYPGLSTEDATQIADCIMNKWDYTGDV